MNILFLCVGNSARSQIAEGLAKSMMGPEYNIQSAGSQPSGSVHKNAISTMKEIGIDISNHESKSLEDLDKEFMNDVDFIITLCAEEPPCQGFSGIGIRRSYSVDKEQLPSNHLYQDMSYFIHKMQPKIFLFENVEGLLSSKWNKEESKVKFLKMY